MKYQYQGSHYLNNKLRKIIDKYELGKLLKSKVKCGCQYHHNMVHVAKYTTVNLQTGEVHTKTDALNSYFCGNTFACPVCGPKRLAIAERRITRVIIGMKKLNYQPLMFTLVVPHHIGMSANEVYTLLLEVRKRLSALRKFRLVLQSMDSRYSITSTECTYSKNGFHFHQHILYFFNMEKFNQKILDEILIYVNQALRNLIKKIHGTYWSTGTDILTYSKDANGKPNFTTSGAYITASIELTANNYKKCRADTSRQMMELLDSDDEIDHLRYLDFMLATRQHHRVEFSRNILKFMADIDDEEVKKNQTTQIIDTHIVASFTADSWNKIFYKHKNADILQAAVYGYDEVYEYCQRENLPLPLLPIGQLVHKVYNTLEVTELVPITIPHVARRKSADDVIPVTATESDSVTA